MVDGCCFHHLCTQETGKWILFIEPKFTKTRTIQPLAVKEEPKCDSNELEMIWFPKKEGKDCYFTFILLKFCPSFLRTRPSPVQMN
jgi:hypothetical protein